MKNETSDCLAGKRVIAEDPSQHFPIKLSIKTKNHSNPKSALTTSGRWTQEEHMLFIVGIL